ncbi:MAG: hypothetical protein QX197_04380, partial [Methylococcaceae bacterium]
MFNIIKKTLTTGVVTERFKTPSDADLEQLGIEIKRHIDKNFYGSIAIRAVDAGSCNGCELEIHALNNPYYLMLRSPQFLQFCIRHLVCLDEQLCPQCKMVGLVLNLQTLQLEHRID